MKQNIIRKTCQVVPALLITGALAACDAHIEEPEVEGQQTVKAWLYSTASGAMQETPKTQAHKVRPIITINN